ncbi:hypothetical protein D1872_271280 [compost metagenome]
MKANLCIIFVPIKLFPQGRVMGNELSADAEGVAFAILQLLDNSLRILGHLIGEFPIQALLCLFLVQMISSILNDSDRELDSQVHINLPIPEDLDYKLALNASGYCLIGNIILGIIDRSGVNLLDEARCFFPFPAHDDV